MGMIIKGLDKVMVDLAHTAERVADTARKTMHRAADKVVEEAKLNVPEDTEALKDAIKKDVSYGNRGRLQIRVGIDGGVINPETNSSVDTYAIRVHENYDDIPGAPGPKTIEKRAANPDRQVGEKFLENAANTVRDKLNAQMIEAITKVLP